MPRRQAGVTEVVALDLSDYDCAAVLLRLRAKRQKERCLVIADDLRAALDGWIEVRGLNRAAVRANSGLRSIVPLRRLSPTRCGWLRGGTPLRLVGLLAVDFPWCVCAFCSASVRCVLSSRRRL